MTMRAALVVAVAGCGRPAAAPVAPVPSEPAVTTRATRLDFPDDIIESGAPVVEAPDDRPALHVEVRALMRDATACIVDRDTRFPRLWIELTIDPAGRAIRVSHGGFGAAGPCVTMVARNRRYRELRDTVRLELP